MPVELRSRFVSVNGVNRRFGETGADGPPSVALHGVGAGTRHCQNDLVLRTQFDMRESMPPDAAFHDVDTAGHRVQDDRPEAVAMVVDQFALSKPSGTAAAAA